jgi:hypothetical protein
MLVAILLGVCFAAVFGVSADGMFSRGDFPAFYAAGVLAASEEPAKMYSLEHQALIQKQHWPQMQGEVLAFSYPPYVAQFLTSFTSLNGPHAKLLFNLLMILALLQAIYFLIQLRKDLGEYKTELLALAFTFAPLSAGLASGQNVALSMLLLTGGFYFLHRGKQLGAGLFFGLLLFKPHYGILALLSLIVSRHYIGFACGACVGLVLYLWSASLLGFGWPQIWLEAVGHFSHADTIANRHQMVSFIGVISSSFPSLIGAAYFISGVFSLFYFYTLARSQQRLQFLISTLGPFIVFVSPHTLFYDLGIAVVSLPLYLKLRSDSQVNSLLFFWILAFAFLMFKESLSIQPLFLFSLGLLILSWTGHLCLSHLNFSEGSDK